MISKYNIHIYIKEIFSHHMSYKFRYYNYPCRSTGSAGGVIALPVSEGNPRLNNMVNLVVVLNTELDHTLDELGKVRAEVAKLRAERTVRHYQDCNALNLGVEFLSSFTHQIQVLLSFLFPFQIGRAHV